MHGKLGWRLLAWNARQISGGHSLWRFHYFPSVKYMQCLPVKHDLTSSPLPSIAILTSKAPQPSKTPKFRLFPLRTNDYPPKEPNASWSKLWAFIGHLRTGKATCYTCIAVFLASEGTGLAHVPCFNSIGKLTTRSDLHRTADWPYNSASRGHGIWHEVALAHGRSWILV